MKKFLVRQSALALKIFAISLCLINRAETFAQGTGLTKCYADKDQDGFGDPNNFVLVQAGFGCPLFDSKPGASNGLDCDDTNADINPNTVWYEDSDNDGFTTGKSLIQCSRPVGYRLLKELKGSGTGECGMAGPDILDYTDCDDTRSNTRNDFKYWFIDNDGDGAVANMDFILMNCTPPGPLNYLGVVPGPALCELQVDCDDNDPLQKPDQEWYFDRDGDGFPQFSTPERTQCENPGPLYKTKGQLTSLDQDCDDDDNTIYPRRWFEDRDGDGLTTGNSAYACTQPDGYILLPGGAQLVDCDDTDPKATFEQNWYPDADGDGHGGGPSVLACKGPAGYFTQVELLSIRDCNDQDENIHPGALEFCNGVDDNCDGQIDETYCCPAGNILYVKANAGGANNGTSWVNAFTRLQDALETARRCNIVDQIWVASGTYYPDEGGGSLNDIQNSTFHPRGGLSIYGGFAGSETQLSQRNFSVPPSILSGEIEQDNLISNNAHNVIILQDISNSFLLDHFTIRDGYSTVVLPEYQSKGAGILVVNSSTVVISNCIVRQNDGFYGAGIATVNSNPLYVNCVVTNNTTTVGNGVVWNDNASPTYANCSIAGNSTPGSDPAAMGNTGTASPTLINTIVRGAAPAIHGGTPTVVYSLIENTSVWPGTGNINGNPLFVNESAGDLHLQTGSPAINAGSNGVNFQQLDIEGNPRKVGVIDMGAYESPFACSSPTQWVVDKDGDGYYPGDPVTACTLPGTGYVVKTDELPGDCNDDDAALNPGTLWYLDKDNDSYYTSFQIGGRPQCTTPGEGWKHKGLLGGGDCNDNDAAINPATIWYRDADGDGYNNPFFIAQISCTSPGPGYTRTTKGADCDDNNPALPATVWYLDQDGDGYDNPLVTGISAPSCTPPGVDYTGTTKGPDCNDDDPAINPETVWILDKDGDGYYKESFTGCNGLDGYKIKSNERPGDCDDNDGSVNPDATWYKDADNDGYSDGTIQTQCARPTGYKLASELTATSGDCNDDNASIHSSQNYYLDADKDGYGNPAEPTSVCSSTPPAGYVKDNTDCNDNSASIHSSQTYYLDADKDGYGDPAKKISVCSSTVPSGYVKDNTDCNDNNRLIHAPVKYYVDNDHDGYGSQTTAMLCSLLPPYGYSLVSLDCNDNNAAVHPFTQEICGNGIDDNCNGQVDESCPVCKNATAFSTTNITSSSANLNWTASANPVQWQVDYKKSSSSSWKSIFLSGSARSVTVSSLFSNQTYNWRIRGKCGYIWTSYSATQSFKTLSSSQTVAQKSILVTEMEERPSTIKLYPNPTNGQFMLELQVGDRSNSKAQIQLVDMFGRAVYSEETKMNNGLLQKSISVSPALAHGIYLVRVVVNDKIYKAQVVYEK